MVHIQSAFLFFVLSIVIHIFYCRRAPMGSLQAKTFILIAAANGVIMGVCFMFFKPTNMDLPYTAVLLYILSIPVYLVFYVSTSLMSPSKKVLQSIHSGATYDALLRALGEENFIALRLGELQDSGCVRPSGEKFILTQGGKNIARVLKAYQMLLGRVGG